MIINKLIIEMYTRGEGFSKTPHFLELTLLFSFLKCSYRGCNASFNETRELSLNINKQTTPLGLDHFYSLFFFLFIHSTLTKQKQNG
jgi:hypothetical protein